MHTQKLLKLLIGCLVIVAGVKVFFGPSLDGAADGKNRGIIQGGRFWATQVNTGPGPEPERSDGPEEEQIQPDAEDTLKIVHLDLKGAAPRLSYLRQLFPLLAALGAQGILLEYEDMFPYEGELELLRSPFAYSVEEVEEIKSLAEQHRLELIPLVQVFGHMEFVLKHERFSRLREVEAFPNSLSAVAPGALELVQEMLTQVLQTHSRARWFHIGADEVRGLGESDASKRWMEKNKADVGKLFLHHVTAVGRFVNKLRPGMKLILWDDMFRKLSADAIKESGLQDLASPMIWNYIPNMNVKEMGDYISRYAAAGFSGVWFAGAFKGASGIDQRVTPVSHHLKNTQQWLKVWAAMRQRHTLALHGLALTGWQRYEHHTVLCELLPVAVPSLAVCLQTLRYGVFGAPAQAEVKRVLGCEVDLQKNDCASASFPGSDLYEMVKKIHSELERSVRRITQSYHVRGSFSSYHRRRNFANPRNLGFFKTELKKLVDEWDSFLLSFRRSMEAVFYPDAVEEWMEENVDEQVERLHRMLEDTERIVQLKGQPKAEPLKSR